MGVATDINMFMFLLRFFFIITSFVVCINREDLDFNLDDDEPEDRDVDATDNNEWDNPIKETIGDKAELEVINNQGERDSAFGHVQRDPLTEVHEDVYDVVDNLVQIGRVENTLNQELMKLVGS